MVCISENFIKNNQKIVWVVKIAECDNHVKRDCEDQKNSGELFRSDSAQICTTYERHPPHVCQL